jgi:uncharacterized protein YigE (DUF2233 family)
MIRLFLLLMLIATPALSAEICGQRIFEGDSFTVCAFDSRAQALRLATTDAKGVPLRSFDALAAALGPAASRARFAMNAGMFDDTGMAIGLLVENGQQRHRLNTAKGGGNFHLKPNGVFSLDADGTLHVETSAGFAKRKAKPLWASQSGPMLMIAGKIHPKITADGPSHYIRNGVGLRDTHHAVFAISDAPVSFGRFARLFRDALHCPNALYFDGSVSSLWLPSQARMDDLRLLGPMVVVLDR